MLVHYTCTSANHSQAFYFSSESDAQHLDRQSTPCLYSWKRYKYGMQGVKFPFQSQFSLENRTCSKFQTWHRQRRHSKKQSSTTKYNYNRINNSNNSNYQHCFNTPSSNGQYKHGVGTGENVTPSISTALRGHVNPTEAVMYERNLSQIIKDTEVLINNSTGSMDIAMPLIHSLFECMRS